MISVIVLLPLAGAATALLAEGLRIHRVAPAAAFASLTGSLMALLLRVPAILRGNLVTENIGGWSEPFGIALRLDGIALVGVMTVLVVALLVYLYAQGEGGYSALFTFFYLVAIAGMVGLIVSSDLFNIFVCFEILSLAAYMLIAYKRKPRAIYAGFRYLVIGTIGMSLYLIGVFVAYRETGVLSVSAVGATYAGTNASPALVTAVAAMLAGIGTRVAFFPFHIWLPEAHSQAPHPVSALLSGVMIKAGFLTLFRIVTAFPAVPVAALFEVLGPVTALLGVLLALAQSDMKRLLAFHSVSQMGYILAGFGMAASAGAYSGIAVSGAIYHMVNHALFKSLLFLTIGIVISATGERNLYRVAGMGRRLPLTAFCFAVAACAICGIPPFNGFASKTLLSAAAKQSAWYPLLRVAAVGTVASFIKLSRVFLPLRAQPDEGTLSVPRQSAALRAAILITAGLCAVLGMYPAFWTQLLGVLTGGAVSVSAAGGVGEAPSAALPPAFYSPDNLLNVLFVAAAGAAACALLSRPRAAAAIGLIRRARLGIDLSVLATIYGFAAIVVVLLLRLYLP